MISASALLFLAFIMDLCLGDPRYRLHPIRLMGLSVSFFEGLLRRAGLDGRWGGILLVVAVETVWAALYLSLSFALHRLGTLLALVLDLFLIYSCLALKDLFVHTDRVILALEKDDVGQARKAISMVVGRDVRRLDEEGIARAGIETLAENFVDGFLSPIFWYLMGAVAGCAAGASPVTSGLCLMIGFKVASTLDSMVGYKDSRFLRFGRAGARLDDIMNFFPARLSLLILLAGAWMCGLRGWQGMRTSLRDRLKHGSPNAAHAESFVAGALGVRLGGPAVYAGGRKDKAWLGEGNPDPGPQDMRRTATLLIRSAWTAVAMSICVLFLMSSVL